MKFFNNRFWAGFAIGIILCIGFVWIIAKSHESGRRYWDDYIPLPNTMTHYEKIGECHYIFEVDTFTNEVKRIIYHVPLGDPESWERKNSATGRNSD